MKVAAVMSDLMLFSRIESAAAAADASLLRVDTPADLPDDCDLVLVDWSARGTDWDEALADHRAGRARVILFGRHTDLEAHAAARASGLGPMWARSKLVSVLPSLVSADPPVPGGDRQGQHSVRINDQWRICFRWRGDDAHDVEIVDYH